ncbi:hypothetical protein [Carboxylicivirga linearis]|uniref:DUF4412 domain-containing protein n=1 Tax=Carboxylicivirga linearis TaxID=1628157 RepID=A0ABS5JSD0_9BACT|nr:hypothetical protein [Carboxylicivirga linearis]MBS2097737.1 hypothetical protein [Carboxylicivirga linearis]
MAKNYKKRNPLSILILALMMISCFSTFAQQKVVKVKVVTDGDSATVKIDSTFTEEVMVFDFDEDAMHMNIDSIVEAHTKGLDKKMQVLAFKMDSLTDMDFNFNFEGNMEEMHKEIERIMKEKGIEMEDLEGFDIAEPHKMIFIGEGVGENTVDVESFVDEEGNHVKVIKKTIQVRDGEEGDDKTSYVIKSVRDGAPVKWHTKTTVSIEPIPMDEVAFLKKIGVSTKKLLNEPLDVREFQVKVEKKIENELKQTLLHIECILPEGGKYDVEMIKKDGEIASKEEKVPSGEMKKEFEVTDEESPYYLILSKNNKIFGRKITL